MKARITLPCGTTVDLEGTPAEIREALPATQAPATPRAPAPMSPIPSAPTPFPIDLPPVIAPTWPTPTRTPFWWLEITCGAFPISTPFSTEVMS